MGGGGVAFEKKEQEQERLVQSLSRVDASEKCPQQIRRHLRLQKITFAQIVLAPIPLKSRSIFVCF